MPPQTPGPEQLDCRISVISPSGRHRETLHLPFAAVAISPALRQLHYPILLPHTSPSHLRPIAHWLSLHEQHPDPEAHPALFRGLNLETPSLLLQAAKTWLLAGTLGLPALQNELVAHLYELYDEIEPVSDYDLPGIDKRVFAVLLAEGQRAGPLLEFVADWYANVYETDEALVEAMRDARVGGRVMELVLGKREYVSAGVPAAWEMWFVDERVGVRGDWRGVLGVVEGYGEEHAPQSRRSRSRGPAARQGAERHMRSAGGDTSVHPEDSRGFPISREPTPGTTTPTSSSTPAATVTNNYNIFIGEHNSDQLSDILRRMNIDPSTVLNDSPRATTPNGPTNNVPLPPPTTTPHPAHPHNATNTATDLPARVRFAEPEQQYTYPYVEDGSESEGEDTPPPSPPPHSQRSAMAGSRYGSRSQGNEQGPRGRGSMRMARDRGGRTPRGNGHGDGQVPRGSGAGSEGLEGGGFGRDGGGLHGRRRSRGGMGGMGEFTGRRGGRG